MYSSFDQYDYLKLQSSYDQQTFHEHGPSIARPYGRFELKNELPDDSAFNRKLYVFTEAVWRDIKPSLAANTASGTINQVRKYRELLKVLLYHIALSLNPEGEGLVISLSPSRYGPNHAQTEGLSYSRLIALLEPLANYRPSDGAGSRSTPAHRCWVRTGSRNGQQLNRTYLYCHDHFKDEFVRAGLLPCPKPGPAKAERKKRLGPVRLSVRSSGDCYHRGSGKEPKKQLKLDRKPTATEAYIDKLTDLVRKAKPELPLESYSQYKATLRTIEDTEETYSLLSSKNDRFYRIFSDEDGSGGRIFGHRLMGIPSELRPLVLLGGSPVVEYDFKSMQVCLAYSILGLRRPAGDLYQIEGFNAADDRDLMKLIFTVSIGSSSSKKIIRDISFHAREDEIWRKQHEYEEAYRAFWSHHAAIAAFIGCEAWRQLQFMESQIALDVIKTLVDQKIPLVPLHDGFLVAEEHEQALEQAMRDAVAELSCPPVPMLAS